MPEPTITITDLTTEQVFTDYFKRRAVLHQTPFVLASIQT